MVGGRRKKKSLSRIHSFSVGRESFNGEHSLIGGPGFSRVVFCNDPESPQATALGYAGNYVRTTKYTLVSFFPKSLYEQFRRVANIYFLLCAIMSFTPLSPYSAVSNVVPLVVVVGVTMGKEAVEDWQRKSQDIEANNRTVKVHAGDGSFVQSKWRNLKVGNIVKVEKDEFFPADLILLSSSYEDGVCYVETTNLDGETNLKLKQALEATSNLSEDYSFRDLRAVIRCEDPNANLYSFIGSMELGEQQLALTPQQLLLRDSKLRNTDHIYGVVIFTGHDTKVMQNSTPPPSKRSNIELRMDKLIYLLFATLVLMSIIGSIIFGITTSEDLDDGIMTRWYLRPDKTTIYYDPTRAPLAATLQFLTAIMLYSYLIPISLYVSIEIVKVLQSVFINQDQNMYYEETDQPARARTSNLNEELGQVETILSDKTGTLTCNSMEFIKCSIAGTSYGVGVTEVERAMARRKGGSPLPQEVMEEEVQAEASEERPSVKGFNFLDERIMNGQWVNEPRADIIQKFLRLLAICHTAIPEVDEENGQVSYEAESPDEAAFVIAARELGFEFFERTQTTISLHELDPTSGENVERCYRLLNVIEFSSSRKRMSVIVSDEDGKLLLLCKGADSVMFERLAKDGSEFEERTKEHINEYADAGLRTLVLAYRKIDENEYEEFNQEFTRARSSVRADREELIDDVANKIERNLILLGATAVEDKLQQGVPECIDKLAQAGIKIWVLTGDKMETAINIGFACSLLRQGMKQIIISAETDEAKSFGKMVDKAAAARATKASVLRQLSEGKATLSASDESSEALALIIDGNSLTHALEDDVKDIFLELAVGCASVICCRSSPKQKALVTRLVKLKSGGATLAIGDGANDVGMLQEADIGIGISGVEGMQAAMSSDIAIAQFRYLERLLLVHGHWCYRRISSMICYFFYKNIAFGFTIFFYETYASFSGQAVYNDWYSSLYNVFFTSLPVIVQGVLEQDVSARICLKFPLLYQEGVRNVLFSWYRIVAWCANGVLSATLIFFFCISAMEQQAFRKGGEVVGLEILGATMYTCVVWVVNCQMALSISYFTYIHHIVIWGGIAFWYIFLIAYGAMDPDISTTAYKVFIEACAPAPSFWLMILFVLVSTLLPYFTLTAIRIPVGQEHQSLGGWHLGESISNGGQHVWSSSTISCVGNGPRFEDNVNLNHQIIRSHNPDAVSQNINLNTRFVDHGNDNFQGTEDPNPFKTSGMENERSSAGVPSPPLDGSRPSCKRKAVEGNIGQSSVSGSSSFFLHPENSSPWPSVPGSYDAGSSSSIPVASQSTMPRLCLGLRGGSSSSNFDAPVTVHPEGSHRNFRLRINPSNENSVPATLSSTGGAVRNLVMPHPHHSIDRYELGSSPAVDANGNQSQPSVIPVPTLLQSRESLRWNESSSARTGNSLTPVSLADTEDANPMSTTRNLLQHPIPPPPVNDLRNLVRSSTSRNLAGGVSGVPSGHVASSSRSGSSSGSYPLTAPSWLVPPPNVSSRSSRRLAEYVRRSLFSSTIAESGGQGDLHTPLHLRPSASSTSSSEEPSGASNPVHHRSQPRSAAWMDRQGEGIVGIPFPLRSLTVGSEGRTRHLSEQIRNVLDLMRRGEGLRLEDVMILDQSVLFGMADIHDRHRDMRLDVDNMSYEELLALEERIGIVNTGLSEENIMKLLKQREYSIALRSDEAEPCCVCQEEYIDGENLGTLDCGHNFHPDCIKQWLMLKNWCPICKTKGLAAS